MRVDHHAYMLSDELAESLYEFFVVFIHAVAYIGQVYPDESFRLVQKYGAATYENNHPGVKQWAETAATSAVKKMIARNKQDKFVVSVAILELGSPIERFGIGMQEFSAEGAPHRDLETQFGDCLTKMMHLPRIPENNDRTLTLMLEGSDISGPDWIGGDGGAHTADVFAVRSLVLSHRSSVLMLNVFRQSL